MQSCITLQSHHTWLSGETARLLAFGSKFPHPRGGAAWLDAQGAPDLAQPLFTWITARMLHVYSLGCLLSHPGSGNLADMAMAGLTGPLRDSTNGGWFPRLETHGAPTRVKSCYDHAFVTLAACTASTARRPGADSLLAEASSTLASHFWDEETGLCVDLWNEDWTSLAPYRGLNGNMHAVEAFLAVFDATGDSSWVTRALRVSAHVVRWAEANHWRIPEHFDENWEPVHDYNFHFQNDPFKPFGATIGHAFEWARLWLQLEATLGDAAPNWLAPGAESLFARAVADGWHADGETGFVYTSDWKGTPVVRDRMHWVVAEAIGAASALFRRTTKVEYSELYALWWKYAARYILDEERGSWHHQLDPQNRPAESVWSGKPDLYHALQATLLPRLPLAPGLAKALLLNRLQ